MAKRDLALPSLDAYRAHDGRWRPPRPEGLARVLAKAGYGARPRTEAICRDGRVTVDGITVTDPGACITRDSVIVLDGAPLVEAPRRYLALHKPPGHECLISGGRSLERLLPDDAIGLEPAGRLDVRATGLLLLSNDLSWNQHISGSPDLERRYEVVVSGHVSEIQLDVMLAGIVLSGRGTFRPERVELIGESVSESRVLVALRGDHARKVRAAFTSLLLEVTRLTRVGIGAVSLGDLRGGHHRDLTAREQQALMPASPGGRS